jgi:hypothetical protein
MTCAPAVSRWSLPGLPRQRAYGDAETKRKALEGGAESLFTKPIDFGVMRSEINTQVGRAA